MFFFKSRSRAELETGFSLEAGRWELLVSFSGPRDGRNVCIDSPPGHCWIHSGTQIWALTICIVSVFELHCSLRVGRAEEPGPGDRRDADARLGQVGLGLLRVAVRHPHGGTPAPSGTYESLLAMPSVLRAPCNAAQVAERSHGSASLLKHFD